MNCRFEPARIAAVVVGIERYAFRDQASTLHGPGLHALEFVELATNAGIEPDRIHLFLSLDDPNALPPRLAALKNKLPPRNAGDELQAFLAHGLAKLDCDLLYFFWCGHGVMTGSERRLLYQDANDDLYHNVSVPELLQYLHSDKFRQTMQIGFVDSCAERTDVERRRLRSQTVLWTDTEGISRVDRSQSFYYAAPPWRTAQSDGSIAYFSKAVLEVLGESPTRLLEPEPDEWNRAIKERFKALWPREARQFGPVSYIEFGSGDGRSEILIPGSRPAASGAAGRDVRDRLLDKVENQPIRSGLQQGLREAIRIDFGMTELPGALVAGLREYTRLESGAAVEKPIHGRVEEIFENGGGQMLILGDAGSGKTTLLLELAEVLVAQARQDETAAIPIVLSLSRWSVGSGLANRERTLAKWIEDDLVEQYKIAQAAAHEFVAQDRILPLLDGLDEMAADRRAACIDRIHEYQRTRNLGRLVVTCRTADYAALPKLNLELAVRLEKLSRKDVERELAKPGLELVRQAMEDDKTLWEVVDTPLWLHVLYGAAQAPPVPYSANQSPRDRLYARYVNYALSRKGELAGRWRSDGRVMIRRLSWLAKSMKERSRVEFAVKDLDAFWLYGTPAGTVTLAVAFAAVAGVAAGVAGGPRMGVAVTVGSLITGFGVRIVYQIALSRFRVNKFLVFDLLLNVLLSAICYALAGAIAGLRAAGIPSAAVLGVAAALVILITTPVRYAFFWIRYRTPSLDRKAYRSAYSAFVNLASYLLAFVLLVRPLGSRWASSHLAPVAGPLIVGWAASSILAWGIHYPIRLVLWLRGVAPLRYAQFLDEAVERLFLIRAADEYKFIHLTFRDYMAIRPPE